MKVQNQTLGELLGDPRIALIAPDAIRNRDLSKEEAWNKTPDRKVGMALLTDPAHAWPDGRNGPLTGSRRFELPMDDG